VNLPHGLRAFRHRNFRLFFYAQGSKQTGTWLQLIATSWLVHRLSDSAFMLGLSGFALQIPFLALAPFAGVLVDRFDRRRVLAVTNLVSAAQAVALLVLVATGRIEVWHLVAGNFVFGVANTFDAPARQSLLVELVGGREDLPSGIALNSSMMNGARFIGPMLGGAVIAAFGEVWGFALNSLLSLSLLGAMRVMRLAPRHVAPSHAPWWHQLRAGVAYAYGFLPTRAALLLLSAVSFSVNPYQSLMPWFAEKVYAGGSGTLGLLLGAGGLGAVSGMLYLATRPSIRGLFRLIGAYALIAGAALLGFAFCRWLWLGFGLVYLVGMGMMLVAASTNTILQSIVPDEMRGRVASLYVMAFLGASPLGALAGGWVGEHYGPPVTLAAGGALVLAAAMLYTLRLPAIRREIRPLYERLGIAPRADQSLR
jgi:MFS family permease